MNRLSIFIIGLFLLLGCSTEHQTLFNGEEIEAEVITEGYRFTEGPYWHQDGYLLFSDIPANKVYKWTPGGETEVFIDSSGNSNGIQADINGSIILAQHSGRLSRLTAEGELEILVDNYKGNRLNSPNDLAVHSSNTIYFTDPPFGVNEKDRKLNFSGVFKLSPDGKLELIYDEFSRPNGIVLSPDETELYINDSVTGDIIAFDVNQNGSTFNPKKFASVGPRAVAEGGEVTFIGFEQNGTMYNLLGGADGMVTDMDGRLYTTSAAGLTIFDSSGKHLKDISFDKRTTNLEWGGIGHNILYVTSPDRVYRLKFNVRGNKKR